MNTSQLPYIIAIAATGSLSAAARSLGISQPALTKYLTELENTVGLALFKREKRHLIPTPAGTLYLKTAREILQFEEATHRAIDALDTNVRQDLFIGVSPHLGAEILGDIYPAFNRAYPNINLTPCEGYSQTLLDDVRTGKTSFCTTSGAGGHGLDMYLMESEEIGLAVPIFNADAKQQGSTLESLPFTTLQEHKNSVFIMPKEASALYDAIQPFCAAEKFKAQVAFSTPNINMERRMISAGAGVGFLPLRPQAPLKGMLLYRLPNAPHLNSGLFARKGYVFKEHERFLHFLWLQNRLSKNAMIVWNNYNRALIQQFAPELIPQLPQEEKP